MLIQRAQQKRKLLSLSRFYFCPLCRSVLVFSDWLDPRIAWFPRWWKVALPPEMIEGRSANYFSIRPGYSDKNNNNGLSIGENELGKPYIYQDLTTKPGALYRATLYVRAGTGRIWRAHKEDIEGVSSHVVYFHDSPQGQAAATSWMKHEMVFEASHTRTRFYIQHLASGGSQTFMYFDKISVYEVIPADKDGKSEALKNVGRNLIDHGEFENSYESWNIGQEAALAIVHPWQNSVSLAERMEFPNMITIFPAAPPLPMPSRFRVMTKISFDCSGKIIKGGAVKPNRTVVSLSSFQIKLI
jgi:hypothetical protein